MHHIPDDVFLIAARELAASVRDEDLEVGSLYPPLDAIREVSLKIAIGITKYAYCKGMSTRIHHSTQRLHLTATLKLRRNYSLYRLMMNFLNIPCTNDT